MRFLVTAICSMSAECVIKQLKKDGHFVVGCDIYPGEWHYETILCDRFTRAPQATEEKEYIKFLTDVCKNNGLKFIIPLTDLEIDVINRHRQKFDECHIVLCMQSAEVLSLARDKYKLSIAFINDANVPSVRTCLLTKLPSDFTFPCIAKLYNGRSSEGLLRNATYEQLMAIEEKDNYIVQEQLDGNVFTVDYCRYGKTGRDVAIPRQELLRTKNGAGLTIQTTSDKSLIKLVSYIGKKLNINGCVNLEFILNNGKYYLIDINPRFSAGVAFSVLLGYDMVINHIRCFINMDIDKQIPLTKKIILKKYQEVIIDNQHDTNYYSCQNLLKIKQ